MKNSRGYFSELKIRRDRLQPKKPRKQHGTLLFTHICNHLCEHVLRIPVSKVSIWPEGLPLTTLHNLTKLRIEKCEELEIKVAASTKSVDFPYRVLVEVIRNICGTAERIHLGIPIKHTFKCDTSYFKCHHLTIDRPTPWLTGKNLFKMRCAQMEISRSRLKVKDLLNFVEKWMKSDLSEEFEFLDITFEKKIKILTFPKSFQAKTWNKEMRGQHYLAGTKVIDCEHGGDVVHKNGRTIATVCTQSDRKRFFFGVWHNPFPMIPQENVPEMLSCSLTCLRICNVAKSLEYESISWNVDISKEGTFLQFKCNDEVCGTWSFKESGNTVTVSKKEDPNTIIYEEESENVYDSLTSAIIHVTDVLKCTVSNVEIWIQDFKHFIIHKLMRLKIEKCLNMRIYLAIKEKIPVTLDPWLATVIKNVCATGRLYISVPTDESFECDPSHFKCHLLVMDQPSPWLTPETL
ncbi:hypothetical protein GCK72_017588 [Caenorhabditis remanei]|uniref:Sdz-33 F-box domain-containing protein n=1 Tax=Caenorhabditis remanei TaxID=31234 RepID=A0A6A5G875_CAERE|nr:hypothetical protein GCK72_017588 [Caenorhabditis remanei]KAF1751036.1 hypothetical protein GCK72_017588 [Caenorhabditis remanei]